MLRNNPHYKNTCRFIIAVFCFLVVLPSCSRETVTAGRDEVTVIASLEDSPYQAEIRIFRLTATPPEINHFSYGLNMGKDGQLYLGIGDNHSNGHLLRYDPQTEEFSNLGNFRDTLPADVFNRGNFGKFHVGPWQDLDGAVYFASYPREHWDKEPAGRLFRYSANEGMVDLGPVPNNQGVYFMYGDDLRRKLYFANRDSHFSTYDIATGRWEDKGKFTSKAPFIGLMDSAGRLYTYGYDGVGDWNAGPSTIVRYDPDADSLEISRNAPPTLWVGAVSPDQEIAYTTSYPDTELFRWHLSDWPDFITEELGRMDPRGRAVSSNDLSLTPDQQLLVMAGTIESKNNWFLGNLHGLWVYEMASGAKYHVADLNEALSESLGLDAGKRVIYWTNANTVDRDGWIYIGIHTQPADATAIARLVAVRISKKAAS